MQIKFREEHCRALATLQSTDLIVKFHGCIFEPQDAEGILIEWFRNNRVVTEFVDCSTKCSMISALSGNDSVKRLSMMPSGYGNDEDQIRFLVQALPGNMGLEHLTLNYFTFTDERWELLFARCRHTLACSVCTFLICRQQTVDLFQLKERPLE